MNRKKIIVLIVASTMLCSLGISTYVISMNLHQSKESMVTYNENNNYKTNETLNVLNTNKKSEIISSVNTSSRIISISFEGLEDEDTMISILELLNTYKVKATFIISGVSAAENSDIVKKIKDEGHEIGSASLSDKKDSDEKSKEELIYDFSKANKIIENIINENVHLLKYKSNEYSDKVLESAYASGNEYVLQSDIYLNYQSFKDYEETYNYISRLKNGSILSIKLNGVLDETEYSRKTNNEKPAIDKKAGINEKYNIEKKQEITTLQMLEWLLRALTQNKRVVVQVSDLVNIVPENNSILNNKNYNYLYANNNIYKSNTFKEVDYDAKINTEKIDKLDKDLEETIGVENKNEVDLDSVDFNQLIKSNNKKMADVNKEIYTTKRSLTYTFRGLSNEKALDYVLKSLNQINGKGTFFVTKEEIEKYPERINKILEYGNEIGNGGVSSSSKLLSKSSEDIVKEVYEVGIMLKNRGIKTNAYMPGYGYINENVKEALSALKSIEDFKNYELFTYSKSPVITKYKEWKADDIVKDYFDINTYLSLRKGEIVYFRIDSDLFNDDTTVGNIVTILTKNYVEKGYIQRFDYKNKLYYPIQKYLGYSVVSLNELQQINDGNSERYKLNSHYGCLPHRDNNEIDTIIQKNYIGNINVALDGFDETEKSYMDKEGFVNTNGKSAVFFTFDDWGSDVVVNEILYVLNKHNVKATFFIVSKYVDVDSDISNVNPNLLRTIALKGHDIGSHTYNHDILDTDPAQLKVSLDNSYMAMDRVIGDLDALKPYLRPPTLYINKSGLKTAFQCGFNYVINGNISTHDYEASSSEEILVSLESELVKNKGNVVVMHINNQASYTAEALDKFLTKNEQGMYGQVYEVTRLSDYLN